MNALLQTPQGEEGSYPPWPVYWLLALLGALLAFGPAAQAQIGATPGDDGAGIISANFNTYYPATAKAGTTSISAGAATGTGLAVGADDQLSTGTMTIYSSASRAELLEMRSEPNATNANSFSILF
ncbi:MAG TPA: hypothetical protein VF629_03735 [Hymenobacter sp.]|jgi:hypothetical protein|uniref:hypothetical protein n=1 Tax=Hymenobacter sp. TaxID=1898978 RepID=UPI002EDB9830